MHIMFGSPTRADKARNIGQREQQRYHRGNSDTNPAASFEFFLVTIANGSVKDDSGETLL